MIDMDEPTVANVAWSGDVRPLDKLLDKPVQADLLHGAKGTDKGPVEPVPVASDGGAERRRTAADARHPGVLQPHAGVGANQGVRGHAQPAGADGVRHLSTLVHRQRRQQRRHGVTV